MKVPHFLQLHAADGQRLVLEATQGLLAQPAAVSPKFFYDPLGSRLFDAITELAAYYPTRTEAGILAAQGEAIADAVTARLGLRPVMVDLGAGNCEKGARLFPLLDPRTYVAVDISVDYLRHALTCLQRAHPAMDLVGLGMDFSAGLVLPPSLPGVDGQPRLLFYPGSSIGNFRPEEARRLLGDMRAACAGGAVLIGVDLVKSRALLEAAYDDELGVTAAFNLNLLLHLNRLLQADFRVADWRHVALYNASESRIEMHLEARRALRVGWPGGERAFAAGERIHTENSYKWTLPAFSSLLTEAGFREVTAWCDADRWFAVCLAFA
jgi:dimethylhistidine N-methyltransferase